MNEAQLTTRLSRMSLDDMRDLSWLFNEMRRAEESNAVEERDACIHAIVEVLVDPPVRVIRMPGVMP